MNGVLHHVVVSLLCCFAGASGLGLANTTNVQTPVIAPKAPIVAKVATAPKVLTGTLFNTREQRENLDRMRLRGGAIEDEDRATVEPEHSVINGFVKRSDGRDTVWVDDVMKRDPRAEVVGQLGPSVVGGQTRSIVSAATNVTPRRTTAASRAVDNRATVMKLRHRKRMLAPISSFRK